MPVLFSGLGRPSTSALGREMKNSRIYLITFVLTAALFLPVFSFSFFDSYVSPISGILFVLFFGHGFSSGALALVISTALYLVIFTFTARLVHNRSIRIKSTVRRGALRSLPLLAFVFASFLPIIHRDGWGGRSFDYTFWSASVRLVDKLDSP
jgi:hypothetical protein